MASLYQVELGPAVRFHLVVRGKYKVHGNSIMHLATEKITTG